MNACFYRTYEGLKLNAKRKEQAKAERFYRTYEGLKQSSSLFNFQCSIEFLSYL